LVAANRLVDLMLCQVLATRLSSNGLAMRFKQAVE